MRPAPGAVVDAAAVWRQDMLAGDELSFLLWLGEDEEPPNEAMPDDAARVADTAEAWRPWSALDGSATGP